MSLLKKIYVWSVCLEPMLYLLFMNYIYASNLGVSRSLQLIVLFCLFIKCIVSGFKMRVFNIFDPMYKYYFYFMFFSVFSALFGIFYGAYLLPSIPINETMYMSVYRPIVEYIINIYYIFYFVILARFMLKDSESIDYFFKVFTAIFYFSLIVGLLDLVVMHFSDTGYPGIARQIRGSVGVGFRFHGFAGEPRDAFVYLWLGIGVLYLKDIWRNERKLTITKLFFIFIAMGFTQSASGVFGMLFSCGLLFIYLLHRLSLKNKINAITAIIILLFFTFIAVQNSGRLGNYANGFSTLYANLNNGNAIIGNLYQSMTNIYPIWDRWVEVMNLNILPLLIGTGLGTSSVINNFYMMEVNIITNPNANLVRMLYDVGIIGMIFLIKAFIYPIERLNINIDLKLKLLFITLFIVGAYFAHRSVAPFLFLGIMMMAIENKFPSSSKNNKSKYPIKEKI